MKKECDPDYRKYKQSRKKNREEKDEKKLFVGITKSPVQISLFTS